MKRYAFAHGLRRLLVAAGALLLMAAMPLAALAEDGASSSEPKPNPQVHEENQSGWLGGATYRVYGYQEGLVGHTTANGHVIQPEDFFVALPCFCVLSSKGGDEFSVRLEYDGNTVTVPVWDVGPWNVEDNWWDDPSERTWQGLERGMPQAAAAYYDDYNGGKDGWGREITSPGAIDIGDGAFHALGMTGSDWVTVTLLWQEPAKFQLPPLPNGYHDIPTVWWDERPPLDRASVIGDGRFGYVWETGHNVPARLIEWYWANGGLGRFGYPISEFHRKPEPDGRIRYVQYFERAYLELDLSGATNPPAIVIGNIGYDSYVPASAAATVAPFTEQPNARYYAETGHSLQNGFKAYWEANGGAEVFGLPLSEEWSEERDGRKVVMQMFQRARLEWWPDRIGQPDEITRGLLGVELLRSDGWLP